MKFSWGVAACFVVWALGLFYALRLQETYYAKSGPFPDSDIYYQYLSMIVHDSHTQGLGFGLTEAVQGPFRGMGTLNKMGSNTALPWICGALIGVFTPQAALWMGPVIQAPWVLMFLITLYFFFRKALGQGRWAAFLMALPFVFNAGFFFFNGGWCDFAMDLMSYAVLGTALLFYLWTFKSEKLWPWIMTGLFLGASCLWRPIDLVYIALIMAPMELFRLLRSPKDIVYPKKLFLMAALFAVLAGWYFIANADYLHQYYVLSNRDANAHQPIDRALEHWTSLWRNRIGVATLILCGLWFILRTIEAFKNKGWKLFGELNWAALWMAAVPVGFLILTGAGPNHFVCLPSAFGLILFLLIPFKNTGKPNARVLAAMTLASLLIIGVVLKVDHDQADTGMPNVSVKTIEASVNALEKDVRRWELKKATVATIYCRNVNSTTLSFLLIYKQGGYYQGDQGTVCDGITYYFFSAPDNVVRVADQALKGNPGPLAEKIQQTNYIYLPDEASLQAVEKSDHKAFWAPGIRPVLESVKQLKLMPVSDEFRLSENEAYRCYRVDR